MIIDESLVDKYRVQKALDQEAGHSLRGYVAETHDRVQKLSKTQGLNFKYGHPGITSEEEKANKASTRTPRSAGALLGGDYDKR
jgi:hypothetical protein